MAAATARVPLIGIGTGVQDSSPIQVLVRFNSNCEQGGAVAAGSMHGHARGAGDLHCLQAIKRLCR
jgi:predicted polyphosphate/ATP-dependent NAD kinase